MKTATLTLFLIFALTGFSAAQEGFFHAGGTHYRMKEQTAYDEYRIGYTVGVSYLSGLDDGVGFRASADVWRSKLIIREYRTERVPQFTNYNLAAYIVIPLIDHFADGARERLLLEGGYSMKILNGDSGRSVSESQFSFEAALVVISGRWQFRLTTGVSATDEQLAGQTFTVGYCFAGGK